MPPKAPNAKKSRGGDPPGARRRVENDDDNNSNSSSAAAATVTQQQQQPHPASLHIPSIGRILRFAAPTFQRAQELSTVCDTWNEVVRHFSKTFWENKLDCLTCAELCEALGVAATNGWIEVVIQMLPRILAHQAALPPESNDNNNGAALVDSFFFNPNGFATMTALYRAANGGHAAVCQALIEFGGANVGLQLPGCRCPSVLGAAVQSNNALATVRAIAQAYSNCPRQRVLAELHRSTEIATYCDGFEMSPLMLACHQSKSGDLVKCLLEDCGADPNFRSVQAGEQEKYPTALMLAALKSNVPAMTVLLSHGAKVDAVCSSNGRTALHYAAFAGSKRAVEVLLDAGAKIGAVDKERNTALSLARANKSAAVEAFLEDKLLQ